MEKAVIMVGREREGDSYSDHYLLLIRDEYTCSIYNHNSDYQDFFDKMADKFCERLSRERGGLEMDVLNGFRLDHETKKAVKVERVEESIVQELSSRLSDGVARRLIHKDARYAIKVTNPNQNDKVFAS